MMRINLIPMAGDGSRFIRGGYKTPKPLIDVDGLPMVIRAAKSLPKADKYIFVCRESHIANTNIENIIYSHFSNSKIIKINELTEGQAITCMLAKDHIPGDSILTIGASDNDMIYDEKYFSQILQNNDLGGCIWTFRNNQSVLQNPNMYGWVNVTNKQATSISCKKPISNNPINDHAIVGAFTFKKAQYFFDAVKKMTEENHRINNEFYVDVAVDFVLKNKIKLSVIEVDQYVCWGTPKDYETYIYWLKYFKNNKL